MGVREQERRQRGAERRINEAMRRADREVRGRVEARAQEATHRAEEVKRKIERGDVQPRPLPGVREDSMPSMESAEYASGISEEAQKVVDSGGVMVKDMPLEGQPMDPERAE
jgi:hypothetical protein